MGGMTLSPTQLVGHNQEDEWIKAQIEIRIVDLTEHLIKHGTQYGEWQGQTGARGDLIRMGMLTRMFTPEENGTPSYEVVAVTEQGKKWLESTNGK